MNVELLSNFLIRILTRSASEVKHNKFIFFFLLSSSSGLSEFYACPEQTQSLRSESVPLKVQPLIHLFINSAPRNSKSFTSFLVSGSSSRDEQELWRWTPLRLTDGEWTDEVVKKRKRKRKKGTDASYKDISGMTHWDKTLRLTRNELQGIYIPCSLEKASLTPEEELEDTAAGRHCRLTKEKHATEQSVPTCAMNSWSNFPFGVCWQ